jgi:peptidoglycan/LPS O-acetylase OafA/YrhL
LRGLAALVVVAFHAWQSFVHSTAENLYGGWTTGVLSMLGNGAAAVNLFFVISGFVLLQSLMRGPD